MSERLSEISRHMRELRDAIELHNIRYYELDTPTIPDADFDKLFRELEELEQRHP